jgi:Cu(I)/Ag(I) efflux system membrane fusion protein
MKTSKYLYTLFLSILIFSFSACSNNDKAANHEEAHVKYTCSMHPQIIEDKPGNCPICGMELVIKSKQNNSTGLTLSESQMQLANIKTIIVGEANFTESKLLNGRLVSNPNNNLVIASKFAGRVDKLFFKEAGRKINAGQALFQVYSEDLLTLQKDYLLNVKQQITFPSETIYKRLVEASKNKLVLYGYSINQIANLSRENKPNPYVTVFSKSSGVITEVNITEGQYISIGTPILRIENLNSLWVEADIYPSEINHIKIGQKVNISVSGFENESVDGIIEFISPQLNEGNQVLTIRASISNPQSKYQPGMQANINLQFGNKDEVITLPNEAITREESGDFVWIKTDKENFEIRKVEIGQGNDDNIIIKNGIRNGEKVVISGAYLLSSEYILRKGNNAMGGMKM